ncbi:hypothetical protein ACP70R_007048 [Stipagrostis hirtigluma subsp. patula]
MAQLLALVVAAMVLVVAFGTLTAAGAARTLPAEVFWRAALPSAAMPDAIVKLLHPSDETANVPNDDDPPPLPPMDFDYDEYVAAPSPGVLKHVAGARNTAAGGNAAASAPTVFFLEDAVRVGESLPFRTIRRAPTAGDEPAALTPPLQLYTVRAVRAVDGSSFVVCRRDAAGPGAVADDDAVYGCRATGGAARAFAVEVEEVGERADAVMTAAVVCRADASQWDTEEHAAFRLLGAKSGGAAVCHAVPDAQILPAKNARSSA